MERTSLLALMVVMSLGSTARANTPVEVDLDPLEADGLQILKDASGPLTLFLNLDGVGLTAGRGGSSHNESRVMMAKGIGSVVVPPYSGGRLARETLVACVREAFAPFKLNIVTTRPSGTPYIMAVMGGRSSALGFATTTTGVAPYSGGVLSDAVVFAFERRDRGPTSECTTVAHDAGHALGLKHAYKQGELMSYLSYSGQKSFMDASAYCGEYSAQTCSSRQPSQNSYQHLASTLGLKVQGEDPPSPSPAPPAQQPRVARVPPPPRPPRQPAPSTGDNPRYRVRVSFGTPGGQRVRDVTCVASNLALLAHCLGDNGLRLVSKRTANGGRRLSVKRAAPGQKMPDRMASRMAGGKS